MLAPADEAARPRRVAELHGLARVVDLVDPPVAVATLVGLLAVIAAAGLVLLAVGWARGFL
jgi:hypothetical protein